MISILDIKEIIQVENKHKKDQLIGLTGSANDRQNRTKTSVHRFMENSAAKGDEHNAGFLLSNQVLHYNIKREL